MDAYHKVPRRARYCAYLSELRGHREPYRSFSPGSKKIVWETQACPLEKRKTCQLIDLSQRGRQTDGRTDRWMGGWAGGRAGPDRSAAQCSTSSYQLTLDWLLAVELTWVRELGTELVTQSPFGGQAGAMYVRFFPGCGMEWHGMAWYDWF